MANRFLPLYLFLLLLGTAAPLLALDDESITCLPPFSEWEPDSPSAWMIQRGSRDCHGVADVNGALNAGLTFPTPPEVENVKDSLPPELIRVYQYEWAFKLYNECMKRKTGVDPRRGGFIPEWINEWKECNGEVFSRDFTVKMFQFFNTPNTNELLIQLGKKVRDDQCIAILNLTVATKKGLMGHGVTFIETKEIEDGGVEISVREPKRPDKESLLALSPSDANYSSEYGAVLNEGQTFANIPSDLAVPVAVRTAFLKCPVPKEETTEEKRLED